jgi:thiamine biosynthesis lipoprotein ApbE
VNASTVQFDGLDAFTRFEHAAMATTFVFHLRGGAGETSWLAAAAAEAGRLIDQLEDQLSFYRETSEVSRINRAAPGTAIRVSDATLACLLTALEVAAASGGAFDPFAGAASLAAKGQPVPGHLLDQRADDPPGTPCLQVDPAASTVVKLAGRRWLDLGAVGKGHALDAAAAMLQEWGVESGLLVAGGSSVVAFGAGPGPDGTWKLHLGHHRQPEPLALSAPFGLGASGEGFQPGHLIRPPPAAPGGPGPDGADATGPQRTFALAPSAALADALATALFVIPADQRAHLMQAWPEAALLVEPRPPASPFVAAPTSAAEQTASGLFQPLAPPPPPAVVMVIPSWKESRRLPRFLPGLCAAVVEQQLPVHLVVVDDGSPTAEADATAAFVDSLRPSHSFLQPLVRLRPHQGKGGAILHGWHVAGAGAPWLGFVDADGAVPAAEVVRLMQHARTLGPGPAVIAASRLHRDPQRPVQRPLPRALLGRVMAWWSRWRLGHQADDPQCGCKLVSVGLLQGRTFHEHGYGLDLELLRTAREAGAVVENVPIAWHEVSGSHLRLKDLGLLLATVERLRRRGGDLP